MKNWTVLNMAAASAVVHDHTKWEEHVMATAVLFTPSD
jgi:hypothetical protein